MAAVAELSSHRNDSVRASALSVDELDSLSFRWQTIRICAALVGAFGFACLYWLLTMKRQVPPAAVPSREST